MPEGGRRVLAIDPGTRFMGVAVLHERGLVYYGVSVFSRKRPAQALVLSTRDVLERLIDKYSPEVLAYEKSFYIQSRESALLLAQEQEIRRLARVRGLLLRGLSPVTVRERLCGDGWARKREVARRMAARYDDLRTYIAPPGTKRERYWHHLFDAVGVGVVCLEEMVRASEGPVRSAA